MSSPVSILLINIFGCTAVFCETCDLIPEKVVELLSQGADRIICYFDTPPDK